MTQAGELNELADFLLPGTRLDVKTLALHHILSMTGSFESRQLLLAHSKLLKNIITLGFKADEQDATNKDALLTLVNLAADEFNAKSLIMKCPTLVENLIDYICKEESKYGDAACAVLSNLSRDSNNCRKIASYFNLSDANNNKREDYVKVGKITLEGLLKVFCTENFNESNTLNYLAPFICNLTQIEDVRNKIVKENIILLRLLPYTTYEKSIIRRGGIIGAIKNCCFNYDLHKDLLLSPEIDILSHLLLPLAGPEEFDDEDTGKLPDDLQYLPPTKEREEDPDIRIMLIETLMLLCGRKENRDYVIGKNAYVILRELHKCETDEKVLAVCEKLIHFIISDEPEKEFEDLDQVVIPEHLSEKFYKFDASEMKTDDDVKTDEKIVEKI